MSNNELNTKYLVVNQKNILKVYKKLFDFYASNYGKNYGINIKNSSFICYCEMNNEVIGATRAISDMSRNALLVDLIVNEKHRRKGIGTAIINEIIQYCKDKKIINIFLTTDPKRGWLVNYYKKFGFKILNSGKCMILKNN